MTDCGSRLVKTEPRRGAVKHFYSLDVPNAGKLLPVLDLMG
jgi:hypothetical protein